MASQWLDLQRTIFTRFVQQSLRNAGLTTEVKSLTEEFKGGNLIIDLIEALSGQKYPKKRQNPGNMRIKQMNYVGEILKWVTQVGVDTKKIRLSNEDILDGNEKQILALTFQIIVKFLKIDEGDEENLDLREALILWLKNKTQGYQGIEISETKSFTKSFHSGLCFLALIHKMRPKLVDFASLSDNKENWQSNLQQALDLAEKYLNVPQYVTATDIAKLDELSMIVYLSDWYFGVTLLQKQDIAARRVGKLVDLTDLHDKMRAEYTTRAQAVSDWVDAKITELGDRTFDDTLSGVKKLIEEFYVYKNNEKGAKVEEQLDTQALFNNLALRLHNHKRPAWRSPAGTNPDELETKFSQDLEKAEMERSEALYTELARQLRLHKLFKRYSMHGAKLQAWTAENKVTVEKEVKIESVEDAENFIEELALFVGQFGHLKTSSHKDLNALAEELIAERFEKQAEIKQITADVNAAFASLDDLTAKRDAYLKAELQKQKDINEALCQDFATKVKAFQEFLKSKKANLQANTDAKLEEQLEALEKSTADTSGVEGKLAECQEAENKVIAREIERNPHTNLTTNDVSSLWNQVLLLIKKKKELLVEQIEEAKRAGLTEEQMTEITENFNYFDADNSGSLTKKELRTCLQSLGEESSREVVTEIIGKYATADAKTLGKEDFVNYMKDRLGDTDTKEEIVRSFKYLAYDSDVVSGEQLTTVVNDKSFKDKHVDYLKANMAASGEGYDYPTWTEEVFAR